MGQISLERIDCGLQHADVGVDPAHVAIGPPSLADELSTVRREQCVDVLVDNQCGST